MVVLIFDSLALSQAPAKTEGSWHREAQCIVRCACLPPNFSENWTQNRLIWSLQPIHRWAFSLLCASAERSKQSTTMPKPRIDYITKRMIGSNHLSKLFHGIIPKMCDIFLELIHSDSFARSCISSCAVSSSFLCCSRRHLSVDFCQRLLHSQKRTLEHYSLQWSKAPGTDITGLPIVSSEAPRHYTFLGFAKASKRFIHLCVDSGQVPEINSNLILIWRSYPG